MVDQERLRAELKRVRTLINDRADVRARFDKDGNGFIDGEEWEEVRQLVIKRLERDAAESAASGEVAGVPAPLAEGVVGDLAKREAYGRRLGAVEDLDELVLRQEGGIVGQMMGAMARRQYAVYTPSGKIVARIQQRENEAIEDLTNRSLLQSPEINFDVVEAANGERLVFTRRTQGLNFRLDVSNAKSLVIGYVQEKTTLLRSEYQISSSLLPHPWKLVQPLLRPFTLELTDAFDEPRGEIHRQWSGLGSFLTSSNQMHLELRSGTATRELRWALVAAMVLADLAAERRS